MKSNPFQSDKNIFSKITNPTKKREPQRKDQSFPENINSNTNKVNKEPFIGVPYGAKDEINNQKSAVRVSNPGGPSYPAPKMTFGKPNQSQQRSNFDSKFLQSGGMSFNPGFQRQERPEISSKKSDYRMTQYDSKKQEFKISQNNSSYGYPKTNKEKSIEQDYQLTSPAQINKFEEYRKVNNYKQYSPINQPEKKVNQSDFLNIDVLGQGLDKFLADSKNQEEICQMLGITKKQNQPQYAQPSPMHQNFQPSPIHQPTQPSTFHQPTQQYQSYQQNQGQPYQQEMRERQRPQRSTEDKIFGQNKYAIPRQSQEVQSAFTKQKQSIPRRSQPVQMMSSVPKVLEIEEEEEKQYVPTFKYTGLQNENQTYSRYDEEPRATPAPRPQRPLNRQNSNIEVFDYSRVTSSSAQQKSVQELIADQMNSMSINGKYRTFLTASQKIVTVRYKLQPL